MLIAMSTKPPQVVRSHDASSLEAAAEASNSPLTPEVYGLDKWWPDRVIGGSDAEAHPAECPWRPSGELICS